MIPDGGCTPIRSSCGGTNLSEASCPLCESRENERRFVEGEFSLLRCETCDLLFIDPYPSDKDVRERVIDGSAEAADLAGALEDRYDAEVAFYSQYFDDIFKHCSDASSVLEVGCGTGRLLELMSDAGLQAEGVELDPARAEAARTRTGCKVHVTPVEELKAENKYDVITLINVLSHIPSLSDLFDAFNHLLSDQGKLIIMAGEMRGDVEHADAVHWAIPIHMHFLGLSTIDYVSRKFGFRIVHRERMAYSDSLFSEARFKAPGRSRIRNLIKGIVLRIPFALNILRWNYERKRGGRVFSSLIVLAKVTT